MTPISFKASFVKNAQIQQTLSNNKTREKTVSIVELDENNIHDKIAMRDIAVKWNKHLCIYQPEGHNYANGIADSMVSWNKPSENEKNRYFLITKQKNNFKEINPDDVLGAAQFTENKVGKNELTWLQVDPKTNYKQNGTREFKGAGKALVEHIISISKKSITLFADFNAIPFYKNLGFKQANKKDAATLVYKMPSKLMQFCKDLLSKL